MTFFLVIGLVLRIFPFFSHIFRMFTVLNVVYMTISSQEKHNFSLCSCFHAHLTTLLLKILGDQCMGSPTSNFGGTVPPGLRPWKGLCAKLDDRASTGHACLPGVACSRSLGCARWV